MVQTSHLFEPLPDNVRSLAFLDRLRFYLPGWEAPKMAPSLFTDHYGFVVDYLAEALRELRKTSFTELADREFGFGSHLVQRDRKAVQKTFPGLMKIVHPHGEVSRDDMVQLLELALEGRRRVQEQLNKNIVMASTVMIAAPFGLTQEEHGGTWRTIEMARKAKRGQAPSRDRLARRCNDKRALAINVLS